MTDFWPTVGDYLILGFEHILPRGLDHILFILGLFLSTTRLMPLIWQVTAFTLAHSLTLALAVLGLVTVPAHIVEPLIALSIAAVAAETLWQRSRGRPPSRWRPVIVFAFGLLHGLGFAGVLMELGLPTGALAAALAAFNIGVELGQIAVLLIAWALLHRFFARPWYGRAVVVPGAALIGATGLYWTVERILG